MKRVVSLIKNEEISEVLYVRDFLDKIFTIDNGSWKNIDKIEIKNDKLVLSIEGKANYLKNKSQFIGYNGEKSSPTSVLLKNNNLHFDIIIDPNSAIGKSDKTNISDFIIRSAISTIIDNEDSVAAVDGEDKVKCYRNWFRSYERKPDSKYRKEWKKICSKT